MAHIGHTYYIRCHRTHRVLEIRDFSMADEAKVQMHDKTGNWNQIWKFNIDGTIENPHTGRVLEIEGSRESDGAKVQVNSKHDGWHQKWEFDATPGHHLGGYIRNLKTGKVFDIEGWNENDRAGIQIHLSHNPHDHSSWNQLFELEPYR
eukprot:gene23264-31590_t